MTTWDSASLTKLFQTMNKVYKIKKIQAIQMSFSLQNESFVI